MYRSQYEEVVLLPSYAQRCLDGEGLLQRLFTHRSGDCPRTPPGLGGRLVLTFGLGMPAKGFNSGRGFAIVLAGY